MRSLAILGAGGHGRVVADCAETLGWSAITFFDDNPSATSRGPWPLAGTGQCMIADLTKFDEVVVCIGNNPVRLDWHRRLVGQGAVVATLIHARATVSAHAEIGAGTVVLAGAIVNVGTTIGQACIINTGATVDHDNVLADGVHISPGANLGGGVRIGHSSWVGIGAAVREGITIGDRVRIGAGAVVVKSVNDDHTVVGNPARLLNASPNA